MLRHGDTLSDAQFPQAVENLLHYNLSLMNHEAMKAFLQELEAAGAVIDLPPPLPRISIRPHYILARRCVIGTAAGSLSKAIALTGLIHASLPPRPMSFLSSPLRSVPTGGDKRWSMSNFSDLAKTHLAKLATAPAPEPETAPEPERVIPEVDPLTRASRDRMKALTMGRPVAPFYLDEMTDEEIRQKRISGPACSRHAATQSVA